MNARVMATLLVLAGQAWAGCGPAFPKDEPTPVTLGQAVVKIEKSGLGAVVKAEAKGSVFVITLADGTVININPSGKGVKPTAGRDPVSESVAGAGALFHAGKYAEAAKAYEKIASRAANPLDAVNALGGAVRCDAALLKEESIKERLGEIEALLPKLPADERATWGKWLQQAKEPLRPD
jgi:hypothetical protein